MDLGKMALAVSADSKEKETYVKYCREFDMEPSWVNSDFQHKVTKREFTLLGLNKRGRLFTVVIQPKGTTQKEVYSIKQFMDNCISIEV